MVTLVAGGKAGVDTKMPLVIDHHIIEQRRLVERYLAGELDSGLSSAFSDHAVDCEECWDRLQLAQIWLKHEREQPANGHQARTVFDHPENGYFQTIHVTEAAEIAYAGHEDAESASRTSTALALTSTPFRPWQVPALTTLAAVLAVALEFIHQQQLELAQSAERGDTAELPAMARWVMQFEPWHLLLLGTLAALLLVLTPTTFFLWEIQKLAR